MAMVHEEPKDYIDAEIAAALADPAFRKRLEDFERRDANDEIKWVSHDEARRRLGLPPLSEAKN
ncbi:MAG: hypothetical protein ACREN8_08925 [Candidatus Dormibacteraceae bacterium]